MSTTAGARVVDAPAVETTLSYVARLDERPFYYQYEPPPGQPWRNTKGDKRLAAQLLGIATRTIYRKLEADGGNDEGGEEGSDS